MEKEIKDFEKMSAGELLNELTDRILAYEDSGLEMWKWRNERGYSEEDCEESSEWQEWDDLKAEHDEDWCRIRELVRFIKKDDTIWEC